MAATALFWVFSAVVLLCGLLVVTRRNPFESALALVVAFFFLAADFVLLDAPFVALVQVLVYAGAVMVLFIFVIMLLNLRGEEPRLLRRVTPRVLTGSVVAVLLGCAALSVAFLQGAPSSPPPSLPAGFGEVETVGLALLGGRWMVALEAVSVLLTAALAGAVVLAKKEV